MTPLELFANPVTALLFDLFLKATVLLLLAVGLATILRKSSAAVRHRVWSLTFTGLLLLPALSYVMPELQLPILPAEIIHVTSTEETDNESSGVETPAPESLAPQREELLADESSERTPPFDAGTSNEFNPWELGPEGALQYETPNAGNAAAESVTSVADSSVIDIESTSPPTSAEAISVATVQTEPRSRTGSLWLWIWCAGLSVCALPILFGLLQNRVLSGASPNVADSKTLALLDALRATLSINRRVRLIESEHSRIPLTWGLFRPVILFPADWQTWSVERTRLVLLHELAHVKRWDVASQLVARVVCAVYWFHPLCWYAMKRIKIESELSCDDCVLMTGESPQTYASELIGIARSARRMMFPAAVAMAQPSSLEQRIRALLDRARSRLPLGGRLAGVLFVASLLIVAGIAAVTPVVSEVAAETESSVEKEAPEVVAVEETADGSFDNVVQVNDEKVETGDNEAEADEEEDQLSTFRGTVVDPDGKPVAGASVKYLYSFVEYPKDKAWMSREGGVMSSWPPTQLGSFNETTTDKNGRYELARNWSQYERENEQRGTTRLIFSQMIVASIRANDSKLMTGWIRDVTNFQNPDNTSIRIQTAIGGSIRARLIDLEGRPIADARVSVELVTDSKPGEIDRWLSDVKRLFEEGKLPDPDDLVYASSETPSTTAARFPLEAGSVTGEMIGLQPIVSDEQGRFEIPNPGDDRLLALRIQTEGASTVIANVVTREMPRVVARAPRDHVSRFLRRPNDYHGLNATIVIPPSQPIEGVIRDADTQEPIPGVIVSINQGEAVNETDAEGRYRLDGLAPGSAERMSLYTPDSSPYFPLEFIEVPKQPGTARIETNFDLRAGIWIEGRVVNRKTGQGQPIVSLHYSPYLDNPHAERYQTFNSQVRSIITNEYRFMTDSEGRFRLRAIPGRGIVVAVCKAGVFRNGLGADRIEGLEDSRDFASRLTYDDVSKKFSHSMAAVNIPDDAKTATLDLEVDPGGSVTLNVQDPNDKPLQGYKISGHKTSITKPNHSISDSEVEIQGLSPKEQRPVLILHEARKLGRVLEIDADAELGSEKSVKLQPLAKLTGRLLDEIGNPVEEVMVRIDVHNSYPNFSIVLGESFTDSSGRFEFNELLPGGNYRIFCKSESNRLELINSIEPQPGETIDFGDVDITKEKAPEPKRTPGKTTRSDNNTKTNGRITVRGRVVDPDGNPLAGATVRSGMPMYAMLEPLLPPGTQLPMTETKSDAAGRFEISFSRYPVGDLSMYDQRWRNIWTKTEIAASHPDYGPAWVSYEEIADADDFTLKLVPDVPIRGRIVDLEGRPVPNIEVAFSKYGDVSDGDLDAWIEGVKLGELPWTVWKHMPRTVKPRLIGIPETYRTDPQGRFEIRGVGRNRVVQCNYQGDTAAYEEFRAAAREMDPLEKLINTPPNQATETVYGKDFTIVAALSRPVEGIVKDAKTGQSLAGVDVHSYRFTGYPYANHRVLKTKTDENGRFRLTGFPKGDGNRLLALPNDEQPYFMREVDLPNPAGAEPVEVEIELHRGIWITGRVTDKETGRPQHARLYYFPFRDNSYAQDLPEFDSNGNADGDQMHYQTRSDGTFRLVGLPGRAIVGAWSVLKQYRTGVGADQIEGIQENGTFSTFSVANNPGRLWPSNLVEIDPPADPESVEVNFELEFGGSVPVEIVDTDGRPVDGRKLRVDGHLNRGSWAEVNAAQFEVANLQRDEIRTVVFHDEERHLGWVEQVKYDENRNQPLTIRLQPDATITGRLVDGEGDAIAGASLRLDPYPGGDYSIGLSGFTTGKEGRFTILVPAGADYYILAEGIRNIPYAEIAEKLHVEPGETIDLGEIDITSKERPEPKRTPAKMSPSEKTTAAASIESEMRPEENGRQQKVCAGVVVDENDQPVAGAHVVVIDGRVRNLHGGVQLSDDIIVAEATTGKDGRFEFALNGDSHQTLNYPSLIARREGMAIAWKRLHLESPPMDFTFRLAPEQPIRGRLIDIDGNPADGVRVYATSVIKTAPESSQRTGVGYRGEESPDAWIPEITSDEQGRFTIHGIPAGFGVFLQLDATERFAPQDITLNTGDPEQRGERDRTYRSVVKNVEPSEEAVLVLAPAQVFEGVVKYADTGEPAPYARLTIWASQQAEYGSMSTVAGRADAEGRYRITPNPGVRFGVNAYPPEGAPYLARETPSNEEILWKAGDRVKQVNMTLPRGVLVKGKIVEQGTGKPVTDASIQYIPESANNNKLPEHFITGWQGMQYSGADGRFEIVVPPGPGRLLVHGPGWKYVLREIGSWELRTSKPGGVRNYANAIEKIDPEVNSEPLEITLELQPGETVSGRVVDEQGNPVEKAAMITRLAIYPAILNWRGNDEQFKVKDGRFELNGLEEGQEYPVHFSDADNKLGATVVLSTRDKNPTVVLKPCGRAKMRLVDSEGKPVVDRSLWIELVVTPGEAHRYDYSAFRAGKLAADSDDISNVDQRSYQSDENGELLLPVLIPGATYQIAQSRIVQNRTQKFEIAKSFKVQPGETLDLGEIVVERQE